MQPFVDKILREGDPSTRYKLALAGLEGNPSALRNEIRRSTRVLSLLSACAADGRTACHPYTKWTGAHWLLVTLADLAYPPGDRSLLPLRDQVLEWLLDPRRVARRPPTREPYLAPIVTIRGRPRVHASLEGNALYALLALGLDDSRLDALADRLVELQWKDGGWNCDRAPAASCSSFEETLIPLRGLVWHARQRGDRASAAAAKKAAEVFLERGLFRRRSTGAAIARDFTELHYPCYWHYDVLFGLKVLAEGGFIASAKCDEAIALIRSKRRSDGGFPAEGKFWSVGGKGRRSPVSWGPTGIGKLGRAHIRRRATARFAAPKPRAPAELEYEVLRCVRSLYKARANMDDHDLLKEFIVELKTDRDAAKAKEKRDSWTTTAGVSLVFIAVLAAVATQWGAKYSGRTMTALNDATYAQTLASDQWNFYQAKSIKENLYEVSRDEEEANPSEQTPKILGIFSAKAANLAKDKLAIKTAAEKFDHDRQAARNAAHQWSIKGSEMGMAVSAYQLAIAVASVGMLMKKKGFWYASLLMAVGATAQMVLTWIS